MIYLRNELFHQMFGITRRKIITTQRNIAKQARTRRSRNPIAKARSHARARGQSWRKSRRRRLDLSTMPIHRNVAVGVTAFPISRQGRFVHVAIHILNTITKIVLMIITIFTHFDSRVKCNDG